MHKIQFDVNVANGVAIDVADDKYYKRLILLLIKIVLDKVKQLLGLILTLHRNISCYKRQRGLDAITSPSFGFFSTRHISM